MDHPTLSLAGASPAAPYHDFSSAWQAVHGRLLRRARRLCRGDHHLAEELLADTALKAFLYQRRTPERIQDLAGFLFIVLQHVFLDHMRRQQREGALLQSMHGDDDGDDGEPLQISSPAPTPEQQLQQRQALDGIHGLLLRLPPPQQQLFRLRFEQELPYPAIAATLGIKEPLARKRVELLRKKLQAELPPR